MELLSPAGSFEALVAAVQNGADAVYFGGQSFNARQFAENFGESELQRALDYCHLRGVRGYITLNTLLLDRELEGAMRAARFFYRAGADALIVQDIGLIGRIRDELPDFELHASTQMGIHDLEGVELLRGIGFSRVVLSREVPLDQIRYIAAGSAMELEVFAHGAMCASFSGGCLMSSMAGGRSGNRGTCAQPCRKEYRVGKSRGRLLSMADLCLLDRVGELFAAGVTSLKIEGRMKRPEYIALVTRAYRAALDGADAETLSSYKAELLRLFDRGGFQKGYLDGPRHIVTGVELQGAPDEDALRQAKESYRRGNRLRPVKMALELHTGQPSCLKVLCGGVSAVAQGENAVPAKTPQSADRVREQLARLGDTAFALEDAQIENEGGQAYLRAGALNALRRNAIALLEERLAVRRAVPPFAAAPERRVSASSGERRISVKLRTLEQAKAAFEAGADEVVFDPIDIGEVPAEQLQSAKPEGAKLLLALPAVVIRSEQRQRLRKLLQNPAWDGAEANALGQLELIRHLPVRVAGAALNAINAETVYRLLTLGFTRVRLSLELTGPQLRDIIRKGGCELAIYGRAPVMQLLHCPIRAGESGCRNCLGRAGEMIDENNRVFPLHNTRLGEECLLRVSNCNVTDTIDLARGLPPAEAWQLAFEDESAAQIKQKVQDAIAARAGKSIAPVLGSTRGHFNRGVE
ncbi:MAG: DUF3656 domain-containing protein [Bacillota bacterium]